MRQKAARGMSLKISPKVPYSIISIHSEKLAQMALTNQGDTPIDIDADGRAFQDFAWTMLL